MARRKDTIFTKVMVTVIAALLVTIIVAGYKKGGTLLRQIEQQPKTDSIQFALLKQYRTFQIESDSLNSEKNKATNIRINETNDCIKPMAWKINIMFDRDKKNGQIWDEFQKYMKLQSNQ